MTVGRKLLAIEDLIRPEFGDETVWGAQWLNLERLVERGAAQTGLHIPDDVRIGIVRRRAPDALRRHVQQTATTRDGTTYFMMLLIPSGRPGKAVRRMRILWT